MSQIGLVLPNFDKEALTNNPSDIGIFPIDQNEFLNKYEEATRGDACAQNTLVGLMALHVLCPVPGNVLESKGWREATKGYLQVRFWWSYLLSELQKVNTEQSKELIHYLLEEIKRTPGEYRSPNWPPKGKEEFYNHSISGIGNYVSYSITRIIRDGIKELYNENNNIKCISFICNITKYIIEECDPEDSVDFILKVADYAISLGVSKELVIKHACSERFLIEENNLRDIFIDIWNRISSGEHTHIYTPET